jgi:hypothetical protein
MIALEQKESVARPVQSAGTLDIPVHESRSFFLVHLKAGANDAVRFVFAEEILHEARRIHRMTQKRRIFWPASAYSAFSAGSSSADSVL